MSVEKIVKWAVVGAVALGASVIVGPTVYWLATFDSRSGLTEEELAAKTAWVAELRAERARTEAALAGLRSACDEAARSRLAGDLKVAFRLHGPSMRRSDGVGWRLIGDFTATSGGGPDQAYRYECTTADTAVTGLTIEQR